MKKIFFLMVASVLLLFGLQALARQPFEVTQQEMRSAAAGGGWRVTVPITAQNAQGALTATLTFDDPQLIPFEEASQTKTLRPDAKHGYEAVFSMKLKPEAYKGVYAATLQLEGKDAQGTPLAAAIPLSVPFVGGEDEALEEPLRVLSVDAGEKGLSPGEAGVLTITLKNASKRTPIKHLAITVTDPEGDIQARQGHTLLMPSLQPGEKLSLPYPVMLQPGSAPKLHVATVEAAYTRFPMEAGEISRSFTLPVTQPMRLKHGRPELPLSVTQGDLVSFSLPLMNMGKGSIHNALLTFSLAGVSEGESVLAGNILPGETAVAKATFHVSDAQLGRVEGEVVIDYEDEQGRTSSLTLPLKTEILARKPPEKAASRPEDPAQDKAPALSLVQRWWPAGVALLLLAALVIQGAYYRGKLRRLEESKL